MEGLGSTSDLLKKKKLETEIYQFAWKKPLSFFTRRWQIHLKVINCCLFKDKIRKLENFEIKYFTSMSFSTKKRQSNLQSLKLFSFLYDECIFSYIDQPIGIRVWVFSSGPGDWGSILGWVIPKTLKIVLDASLLNTHYNVWIKGKWSIPGKGVAPSPTPWCICYWKRSLHVALNNGWLTYDFIM